MNMHVVMLRRRMSMCMGTTAISTITPVHMHRCMGTTAMTL